MSGVESEELRAEIFLFDHSEVLMGQLYPSKLSTPNSQLFFIPYGWLFAELAYFYAMMRSLCFCL